MKNFKPIKCKFVKDYPIKPQLTKTGTRNNYPDDLSIKENKCVIKNLPIKKNIRADNFKSELSKS